MEHLPARLTIRYLREAYVSGRLTVRRVMEEVVGRAEENPDDCIWIEPPRMDRLESHIGRLEACSPEEVARLPLYGVPFAVKDNIDVAGFVTTAGCPEYAYDPIDSATVVRLLMEAGAVPVGKTNLDQFATGLVGVRSPYGECRNALRPELISGGSSSGSAVAVARGLAAFALGTDTAGSGRVPAALNGVVGFKPPLGSWSTEGVVPACASLDCVTVFAHDVSEARMVDDVVAGYDVACPWSRVYDRRNPCLPDRILLPSEEPRFYGDFSEDYRKGWNEAISLIEHVAARSGLTVERYDTDSLSKAASILYDGPWVAERWKDLGPFVEDHPGATFPVTETILRGGARPEHTATALFESIHFLQRLRHQVNADMEGAVLVMPTCGGTFTRDQVRADPVETNSLMGLYTNHCNLLDLCATALPVCEPERDLPFGITLFGLGGGQELVEGLACTLERARGIEVAVCGQHMRGYELHDQLDERGAVFEGVFQTTGDYRLFALPTDPVKPGLMRALGGASSHPGAMDELGHGGEPTEIEGLAAGGCHAEAESLAAGGRPIEVEVYRMSSAALGAFVASVPSPLCFGKVSLLGKGDVVGFLVEPTAVFDTDGELRDGVEEITASGSFRSYLPVGEDSCYR